jgi:hypothetical protein
MDMRSPLAALLVAAGALLAPARTYADDVTTCGQFVRGNSQLVANLDCSAVDDDAVKLQGRLHLQGFTITAHPAHAVVRCLKGACRVDGPGSLSGGAQGIRSDKNARVVEATVSGNGVGVRALKTARLDSASVSNNGGDGVDADKVKAQLTGLLGNGGRGAHAVRKILLSFCNVAGNAADGLSCERLVRVMHDTTVTGNGLDGIDAGRIFLKVNAEVTMNGTSAACGVTEECNDLATDRRPVVGSGASCGTSRDTGGSGSWGVCLGD